MMHRLAIALLVPVMLSTSGCFWRKAKPTIPPRIAPLPPRAKLPPKPEPIPLPPQILADAVEIASLPYLPAEYEIARPAPPPKPPRGTRRRPEPLADQPKRLLRLLGLPLGCTQVQFTAAWRRFVKRHHPDVNPDQTPDERRRFARDTSHPDIVYEPGKCIVCNACVRIAAWAGEALGLSVIGRGFDVSVAVPFGGSLAEGLREVAGRCAEACPTGALAVRGARSCDLCDTAC